MLTEQGETVEPKDDKQWLLDHLRGMVDKIETQLPNRSEVFLELLDSLPSEVVELCIDRRVSMSNLAIGPDGRGQRLVDMSASTAVFGFSKAKFTREGDVMVAQFPAAKENASELIMVNALARNYRVNSTDKFLMITVPLGGNRKNSGSRPS